VKSLTLAFAGDEIPAGTEQDAPAAGKLPGLGPVKNPDLVEHYGGMGDGLKWLWRFRRRKRLFFYLRC